MWCHSWIIITFRSFLIQIYFIKPCIKPTVVGWREAEMGQAQTAVSGSETSLPNITACTLTELTDMQRN